MQLITLPPPTQITLIACPCLGFYHSYSYFYFIYRWKEFNPLLLVIVIIPLFKPGEVSDEAAHVLYKREVTNVERSGWNLMRNVIPEKTPNLYKLMQLRLIEHCSGPTVKTDKQPSSSVGTCDQIESGIH